MVTTCSGEPEDRPRLHVSAGGGLSRSLLRLSGHDVTLDQWSTVATVEWRTSEKLTLVAGGGAVLGGRLDVDGRAFDVRTGWLTTLGLSHRLADGRGRSPFVLFTASLTFSSARTTNETDDTPLRAGDARIGLLLGKTVGPWSPYAALRAFGGPVLWRLDGTDVSGGDRGHYQIGLGSSFALGKALDAFVEWDWLGERRLAAGLGLAF